MSGNFMESWPSYSKAEKEAVNRVLESGKVNYWTGQECRQFEIEFAQFAQCKYAIAVANGTVALDLAMLGLGLGSGDEVIVTSRTFLASVSSIINSGATPIFADIDLATQNITSDTIAPLITNRTKAILCVHLAGWPCDMDPILRLATEFGLFVIEDCAQAHGAVYKGKSVGALGHVGCWSFCQDKIMSTGGEGGMVTTNSEDLWNKMWSFKDHGKSWSAVYEREHPDGFRWLHETFGTNWRMTEMQGAIGRVQLTKMAEWNEKRLAYMQSIWTAARDYKIFSVPDLKCSSCQTNEIEQCELCQHAGYKCYVYVNGDQDLREIVRKKINDAGVPCMVGSCSEVYLEKAFEGKSYKPSERLKNAKKLGDTSLMFLCHPTLSEEQILLTCEAIRSVGNEFK